jgi:hypothetical protein
MPTPAVSVLLPPPGRAIYELWLPANAEIRIACETDDVELCASRMGRGGYRVWTRRLRAKRSEGT